MRTSLDAALATIEFAIAVDVVDVGTLPAEDYRTGYGTPTLLRDGEDLLGAPRPLPAAPT
ncbi:MAG TPA: hypothetical protein ENI87_03475 [bacterium]|nr:hypothetical protein [bacterium]